jgi:hypothetical protein
MGIVFLGIDFILAELLAIIPSHMYYSDGYNIKVLARGIAEILLRAFSQGGSLRDRVPISLLT